MRINSAGDDASGLAVSEKMRSQIRGLRQATRNAENGISFIQTSEGYLGEMNDIMQRMRELSVQAANGVYSARDREQIQVEVSQLVDEVDRIAEQAQFNNMYMLTGNYSENAAEPQGIQFHIGANMDERVQVFIGTMTSAALKLAPADGGDQGERVAITTPDQANMAIGRVDEAIAKITSQRANLGAYQNRMEHMVKGLEIASENMIAAESQIRDTDMAAEMVDYVKNQILTQSGSAMLASANLKNQAVMRILG